MSDPGQLSVETGWLPETPRHQCDGPRVRTRPGRTRRRDSRARSVVGWTTRLGDRHKEASICVRKQCSSKRKTPRTFGPESRTIPSLRHGRESCALCAEHGSRPRNLPRSTVADRRASFQRVARQRRTGCGRSRAGSGTVDLRRRPRQPRTDRRNRGPRGTRSDRRRPRGRALRVAPRRWHRRSAALFDGRRRPRDWSTPTDLRFTAPTATPYLQLAVLRIGNLSPRPCGALTHPRASLLRECYQ
jgi:hypothetical protein